MLDRTGEFQGALTKAGSPNTNDIAKTQVSGNPQPSESKKKTGSMSSSANDPALSTTATPALPTQEKAIGAIVVQPVVENTLNQRQSEPAANYSITGNLGNETSASLSTLSYALHLPIDITAIGPESNTPANETLKADGSSMKPSNVSDGNHAKQIDIASTVSQSNPFTSGIESLVQASLPRLDSKSMPANPAVADTKTADASKPSTASNTDGPPVSAGQQIAVTAAQTVVAPVSLAVPSATNGLQLSEASTTATRQNANSVSGVARDTPSRQVGTMTKTKPGASSAEVRGKAADGRSSEPQASTSSEQNTAFVKVLDASATTIHNEGKAGPASDTATLQSVSETAASNDASNSAQTAQNPSPSVGTKVQAGPAPALSEAHAQEGITSAQLTQSMRSSEMKLGMQSAEFGAISIKTSLNHQAISAQISIDHAELGRALAVHLPAIEEKLGSTYGVQARVELRESNTSSSNDSGHSSSGQQSREQRPSERGASMTAQGGTFQQIANRSSFTATSGAASGLRLDIRI